MAVECAAGTPTGWLRCFLRRQLVATDLLYVNTVVLTLLPACWLCWYITRCAVGFWISVGLNRLSVGP